MNVAGRELDGRRIARGVVPTAQRAAVMVSWAAIYFIVVLAAMTGLIKVATGWDVVLIDSGSMSPTLKPGDVLFLGEVPEAAIGQQTVITFERPDGELVTHRVFEANAADFTYVTKGDANPEPDTDVVSQDDVVGVGTLVVPFLGLPVVWIATGDLVTLAALGIVALVAIAIVVHSTLRTPTRERSDDPATSASAQRGIGRVRLVVAVMIGAVAVVDNGQLGFSAIGWSGTTTIGVVLTGLAAVSLAGLLRTETMSRRAAKRLAIAELMGDTAVVVLFVAATGTSGIGWTLMALPVIEAAIHFRLTGAFVHWVIMSAATSGALLWTNRVTDAPQSVAIENLEQLIDRLGVLLLVVIPGSYLAEQLLGDVLAQRRATSLARERSRTIEMVTTSGRDLARLDADLFPTLVAATRELGFDVADCWTGHPDEGWVRLTVASDGPELPRPESPGSTMRAGDLTVAEVFVDEHDPDPEAAAVLAEAGLATLIRITLIHRESMYVVLRCAAREMSMDPVSTAMGLRLLAGQAVVALQNEQLMNDLRRSHNEIAHQAHHDSLTGLPNRARFVESLGDALEAFGPNSRPTSVMFLDLNGFKAINDRLGHNAGDSLLRRVAEVLRAAARHGELVARLGGDEFTVLLGDHQPGDELQLAEVIHTLVNEPIDVGTEQVTVSTSIGIATAEPGMAVSEMLRRADLAMYAAKEAGGNRRTRSYTADLDEAERRTRRLTDDIAQAIGADQGLELRYQPVVSTVDDRIVGVEALIRWTHPYLGAVPPPEIIELAENADCLDALNRWILETSMQAISACDYITDERLFIAVNVSPGELQLPTLGKNVAAAIKRSGLDADRVVVELNERIVANSAQSEACMHRLLDHGVRLALDDFGEGQTSLAHLRNWPISYLKLDRLFILHSAESEVDRKILQSVIALSHDLGFEVIAEGIENIEQHTIVTKVGADLLQGFGLYRPLTLDDLRATLATARRSPVPSRIDDTPPPPTVEAAAVGAGQTSYEAVARAATPTPTRPPTNAPVPTLPTLPPPGATPTPAPRLGRPLLPVVPPPPGGSSDAS